MFLVLVITCAQESSTEEEEEWCKQGQKHLDKCPETREAVTEDFCNTEANTNAC